MHIFFVDEYPDGVVRLHDAECVSLDVADDFEDVGECFLDIGVLDEGDFREVVFCGDVDCLTQCFGCFLEDVIKTMLGIAADCVDYCVEGCVDIFCFDEVSCEGTGVDKALVGVLV